MKKILSLLLVLTMLMGMSTNVFAGTGISENEQKDAVPKSEIYKNEEQGYIITRVMESGVIKVVYEDLTTGEHYMAINSGENIFLDDELVSTSPEVVNRDVHSDIGRELTVLSKSKSSVRWGKWTSFSSKVKTGGKKAAAISAMICAAAPWISIRVVSGVAGVIQASYNYVLIKGKIRYGTEGKYQHYERYTNIYGNGKDALLSKAFHEHRKTARK